MANTYTRAFENSSVILANLQAKDIDGMNEDQRAKHTEELKAAQDPIGNFGRLLSTYNLKGRRFGWSHLWRFCVWIRSCWFSVGWCSIIYVF